MDEDKNTPVLSGRLQTLCGMVTPGKTVVDVGCDHAYADIFLIRQGICPKALAMDVRKGPLAGAREHVKDCGVEPYIEIRLSDGLEAYRTGEASVLICAGMGGRLMQRILERDKAKTESFDELILQPQSELAEFRAFLRVNGYFLLREEALVEGGKYYFPMKAVLGRGADAAERARQKEMFDGLCGRLRAVGFWGKECVKWENEEKAVTELCDAFGMGLLWEQNDCLHAYLTAGFKKLLNLESALSGRESESARERIRLLAAETAKYRQALALFETF
ncbi:MAG: class I SAM-dependent methyltransferase [Candidatus Gastranaerophilales bacterium]|nr:class I SAM-dependent methyltransferase [Candidatus Gastranaerophilales bacterium]